MTLNIAKETIVRKFTNYRNKIRRTLGNEEAISSREMADAFAQAAAALVDLQKVKQGKSCFKTAMHMEICLRRDQIMADVPNMSKVGAYQKALKELWSTADQEEWESKAAESIEDIFEYVYLLIYV